MAHSGTTGALFISTSLGFSKAAATIQTTGRLPSLYTHKTGEAALNWASIKEGDNLLMLLEGGYEVVYEVLIFHMLVAKRCSDNCDILLCHHPGPLLKKEKQEGGSLQWLEYSTIHEEEGKEDELVIASVEEHFGRHLQSFNGSNNLFVRVDDVNEMY
ncbi:hypothetical protein BJ741DRAFT_651019 [Chytriomyces cf. hyalinus JEL632]|nr:hypothetical protein BJ741DRAFT_651019 [Chytriomyces cf. hyalinus JEL632]